MGQRDFNKEMGSYINHRTEAEKKPFKRFKFLLQRDFEDEVPPDIKPGEIHVEYKSPSRFSRLFNFGSKRIDDLEEDFPEEVAELKEVEKEIEELENVEEQVEERRESLIATLIQKFKNLSPKEKELEEEFTEEVAATPELDSEVKECLLIAHSWLEQLPAKKKHEFKESSDFGRYKELLGKYNLIKPKE